MQSNAVSSVISATSAPTGAPSTDCPPPTSSLLPDPTGCSLSSGSVAGLAALLTRIEDQDRTNARELQQMTDRNAIQEETQRVQALRQKADDDQSQAWATGLAGIAGGALTAASAFAAAGSNLGTTLGGAGKVAPEVGTLVAGGFKAASDRDDADAVQFQTEAETDLRFYQEAGDEVQSANDSIQKVRSFLDNVQQTENATRLAAAGYRA